MKIIYEYVHNQVANSIYEMFTGTSEIHNRQSAKFIIHNPEDAYYVSQCVFVAFNLEKYWGFFVVLVI